MPQPGTITPADIAHRFTNHPPTHTVTAELMDEVTERFIDVGTWLANVMPVGREASLAITHLEQASMWAKAAIARNQTGEEPESARRPGPGFATDGDG